MEENKRYLLENVNHIIEPMLQKITQEKPKDVLLWMSLYISGKI
jgi:hypothetical protein